MGLRSFGFGDAGVEGFSWQFGAEGLGGLGFWGVGV